VTGSAALGPQTTRAASPDFTKPALITIDTTSGALEYWPIAPSGGTQPTVISKPLGIFQGYAMAADGNVVAIANYSPPEVLSYNVKTKTAKTLSDPYGDPLDIAVDKHGTLYAMNGANVAVFKAGSSQPTELSCGYMTEAEAIAVDNEGDVFVNGYGPGGFVGVVEYPVGSSSCTKLHLRSESGYVAGVGIDPTNDDLIVVDDPDLCAGGLEGRMRIYSKPYGRSHVRRHNLRSTYCAGTFRLNSSANLIFVSDATVSDGYPLIDQETYPAAKSEGPYQIGASPSGSFGGFTTIPNTLPN
jgi:hypothetical protein